MTGSASQAMDVAFLQITYLKGRGSGGGGVTGSEIARGWRIFLDPIFSAQASHLVALARK